MDYLNLVRSDVDAFVGDAPQFDDITMLGLRFFGPYGKKTEGKTEGGI